MREDKLGAQFLLIDNPALFVVYAERHNMGDKLSQGATVVTAHSKHACYDGVFVSVGYVSAA